MSEYDLLSRLALHQEGIRLLEAELRHRGAVSVTKSDGPLELHATNADHSRTVDLRVFAKRGANWHSRITEGQPTDDPPPQEDVTAFWVFMHFGGPIRYWITPEWWIRDNIYHEHQRYLSAHGGRRSKNPDSDHHAVKEHHIKSWRDRWDILGLF
jgi:hypothetical protein